METIIDIPEGYKLIKTDDTHYEIKEIKKVPLSMSEYLISNKKDYIKTSVYCPKFIENKVQAYNNLLCLYNCWTSNK